MGPPTHYTTFVDTSPDIDMGDCGGASSSSSSPSAPTPTPKPYSYAQNSIQPENTRSQRQRHQQHQQHQQNQQQQQYPSQQQEQQQPLPLSKIWIRNSMVSDGEVASEVWEILKELDARMATDKKEMAQELTALKRSVDRVGHDHEALTKQQDNDSTQTEDLWGEDGPMMSEIRKVKEENAALKEEVKRLRKESKANRAEIEKEKLKQEDLVLENKKRARENVDIGNAVEDLKKDTDATKKAFKKLEEESNTTLNRHDKENVAVRKESGDTKKAVNELAKQIKISSTEEANRGKTLREENRELRREINELKQKFEVLGKRVEELTNTRSATKPAPAPLCVAQGLWQQKTSKEDEEGSSDDGTNHTIRVAQVRHTTVRTRSTNPRTPMTAVSHSTGGASSAAFLTRVSYNPAASMTDNARTNAFIDFIIQQYEFKNGVNVSHDSRAKMEIRSYAVMNEPRLVRGDKHEVRRIEVNFLGGRDLHWAMSGDTLDKYTQRRETYPNGYH
ncbi:hypothetical protein SLS58_000485 [Diplodia intermedia]|uniref:Uncharacterized protein n=1 Tax=Diplodia intermedia TaxID=856260 RepID=A0ABR3U3U8_9PEZI